ncbi:MAG: hypothetical protein KTR31_22240 [Myxococcales bacterium]|nr:hypothetical protein [Myxococcales bacterium]
MHMLLVALAPSAQAQGLEWLIDFSQESGSHWNFFTPCDAGYTAISGTANYAPNDLPSGALTGTLPTPLGWGGTWDQPLGMVSSSGLATQGVGALCADDQTHFDCLTHVVGESPLTPDPTADFTVSCPVGTYVVGGGAEIIGDDTGVVFRAAAPTGLTWMIGYRAIAEVLDPDKHGDWAIRIEAWCAEPAVMSTIGKVDGTMNTTKTWLGSSIGASYLTVGTGLDESLVAQCDNPLVPGMAAFPPNVVGGMGWDVTGAWSYRVNQYQRASDPASAVTNIRAVCSSDFEGFSQDLESCPPPPPPSTSPFDPDLPTLGATLLFGVADGSPGLVLIPGEGPVPVPGGYLPWKEQAAALPVGVLPYEEGLQQHVIDLVTESLDAERTAWSTSTDIATTLDSTGVVLVTARDEQAAADWLQEHRGEFEGQKESLVILLVQSDSEALTSMFRW